MRAVAGFTGRGGGRRVWRGVSDAEHPGHGRGLGEGDGVGEGVGGGGEERRGEGGGRRGESLLGRDSGGAGAGEGQEALGSRRHLPPHLRVEVFLHHTLERQPHPVPSPVEHVVAPSHESAAEYTTP